MPEHWEERVAEAMIPAEEREDLERRERELKARIERATRLHLEGHISYERFAEERHRAQAGLADLRPARMEATIAAKEAVEEIAHRWEAMGKAKLNGLLRKAVAEAHVEGTRLTAVRPTLPLYPLVGIFVRAGPTGVVSAGYIKANSILVNNQLNKSPLPRVPSRRARNAATAGGDPAPNQREGSQLPPPMPRVSISGRREPTYDRPTLDQAPPLASAAGCRTDRVASPLRGVDKPTP